MPYLGIFKLELKKKYCHISTLKFIKNDSLTHTVNFGIWFAFTKGPGAGPGPLYKACPNNVLNLI